MTVKIEKPSVNVTEKLNELDRKVGAAGAAAMASDTHHQLFNMVGAGRKNLIINGNFDFWQRGTSFTSTGYTADRWYLNESGATTTLSRQEFAVGHKDVGAPARYFMRLDVTSANDNAGIWQKIEDVRRCSAQKTTLSFWARVYDETPNGTGRDTEINLKFIQDFGDGGSPSSNNVVILKVLLTDEWKYHVVNIEWDSIEGKTLGTNDDSNFAIEWSNPTSETWSMDIAQVQLEYGTVATPFEIRNLGEELALCQRYFQVPWSRLVTGRVDANWQGNPLSIFSTTRAFTKVSLPVTMRALPTVTVHNPDFDIAWNGTSRNLTSQPSNTYGDTQGVGLDLNNDGTAFVVGYSGHVDIGGGCHVTLDAEL